MQARKKDKSFAVSSKLEGDRDHQPQLAESKDAAARLLVML